MADVALIWKNGVGDLLINQANTDLETGQDLKTAIIVSLFTDARASVNDIPKNDDPRGWWNAEIGSLLWLLHREKTTNQNLEKGINFIKNSLNWLLTLGIASKIDVTGLIQNRQRFKFHITISRSLDSRYDYIWQDITNETYKFDESEFFIAYN
jgi:phage gp46-like protein